MENVQIPLAVYKSSYLCISFSSAHITACVYAFCSSQMLIFALSSSRITARLFVLDCFTYFFKAGTCFQKELLKICT